VAGGRSLVVGTRGSRLALRQTDLAVEAIRAKHPDLAFEIREVRTEGDRSTASLLEIGGQGVFVKELEAALQRGDIDIAVHSLKDVPNDIADGLTLAAVLERADPRDALVTRDGGPLTDLPPAARIGTGSARRAVQLRALRPDIEPVDIRGNVDTRVRKVDEGEFDGAVLAVAGLERLGLLDRISETFDVDVMLPSVGQGAMTIEARAHDADLHELLRAVDHRESRLACEAERSFLKFLGGGCSLPFGGLAGIHGSTLEVRGFLSDEDGEHLLRDEVAGKPEDAERLGVALAAELLMAFEREARQ
jgi:hydroxymethylbilane synthase